MPQYQLKAGDNAILLELDPDPDGDDDRCVLEVVDAKGCVSEVTVPVSYVKPASVRMSPFEWVITQLIRVIVLTLWLVIGFLLWVPLLVRMISSLAFNAMVSTYTKADVGEVQLALREAVSFYGRGFSTINRAVSEDATTYLASRPMGATAWKKLIQEIFWATLFWLMTLAMFSQFYDRFVRSVPPQKQQESKPLLSDRVAEPQSPAFPKHLEERLFPEHLVGKSIEEIQKMINEINEATKGKQRTDIQTANFELLGKERNRLRKILKTQNKK